MKKPTDTTNTTYTLVGLGKPKMHLEEVEKPGREIGHIVFEQSFATVEITWLPKPTGPNKSNFKVNVDIKSYQCESSYATTCGGNCTADE